MFFWFIIIVVASSVLLYIFRYLKKLLLVDAFINVFGVQKSYYFFSLYLCLFLLISFGGYFIKSSPQNIDYSYDNQKQERRNFIDNLTQIAAQQFASQLYSKAENSYRIILLSGEIRSNILVGYVLSQIAQNIHNTNEQVALLQKAIAINPFDIYPHIILKQIIGKNAQKYK